MKLNHPIYTFRDEPVHVSTIRAMTVRVGGVAWQAAWWMKVTRISSRGGRP